MSGIHDSIPEPPAINFLCSALASFHVSCAFLHSFSSVFLSSFQMLSALLLWFSGTAHHYILLLFRISSYLYHITFFSQEVLSSPTAYRSGQVTWIICSFIFAFHILIIPYFFYENKFSFYRDKPFLCWWSDTTAKIRITPIGTTICITEKLFNIAFPLNIALNPMLIAKSEPRR